MERRGRIPVAKFRTQEGKTRSRSRVREPDYNEQDPETDLFTLLEDNIALKEENKELKSQLEDMKKSQNATLDEKNRIREQLFSLERQQESAEMQMRELTGKLTKANNDRNALDKLYKLKMESISSLEHKLQTLQINGSLTSPDPIIRPLTASKTLREKLIKILPTLSNSSELESLIDVESTEAVPITSEIVERMVDEFFSIRNSFNSVELQLYEANEKIAELIENQHHLAEENETLRNENTNLTKVAKLLTENMKESVETSKKMETALIKLKQRNDELVAKSRDWIDGHPSENASPTITPNVEEQIKEEQIQEEQKEEIHNERIVEMKTILEAAIQKTTNDELKTLQLKLEILEQELRKATERAENAENELEKYKIREQKHEREQQQQEQTEISSPPPPPPPPPPPLPVNFMYKTTPVKTIVASVEMNSSFSDSIASHNINNKENSKIIDNILHQVQPEAATGVDALVRELKSGRVTLRRNRRQTRTNPALQEMFDMLEISQKQNRNSKICIDLHR